MTEVNDAGSQRIGTYIRPEQRRYDNEATGRGTCSKPGGREARYPTGFGDKAPLLHIEGPYGSGT